MTEKKVNRKSLYAIIGVLLFGIVGATFAYYTTTNTYTNEFETGEYKIKTEEVFESPPNWQPGDITPKQVTVTNEGTVDAAVKVCFRQKWEDKNGNPVNTGAVTLHYEDYHSVYWLRDCDDDINCYYYYKKLAPGETTEDLLESVEFYGGSRIGATTTCTEDPVTHTKSCTSEVEDYSGSKYTLYVDIETVQFNAYKEAWDNPTYYSGDGMCKKLNIMRSIPNRGNENVSYLFHYKLMLKDYELSNWDLSEAKCRPVYVGSVSEENLYNDCEGVRYNDGNYHEGVTVRTKSFRVLADFTEYNFDIYDEDNLDDIVIASSTAVKNRLVTYLEYSKYGMISNFYTYNDNDNEVMNISGLPNVTDDWILNGFISFPTSIPFTMPNHSVLLEIWLNPYE